MKQVLRLAKTVRYYSDWDGHVHWVTKAKARVFSSDVPLDMSDMVYLQEPLPGTDTPDLIAEPI